MNNFRLRYEFRWTLSTRCLSSFLGQYHFQISVRSNMYKNLQNIWRNIFLWEKCLLTCLKRCFWSGGYEVTSLTDMLLRMTGLWPRPLHGASSRTRSNPPGGYSGPPVMSNNEQQYNSHINDDIDLSKLKHMLQNITLLKKYRFDYHYFY